MSLPFVLMPLYVYIYSLFTSSEVSSLWLLTVLVVVLPALHTHLRDGGEDGAVSAAFAHQVHNPVCDFFNWSIAAGAVIRNLQENRTGLHTFTLLLLCAFK